MVIVILLCTFAPVIAQADRQSPTGNSTGVAGRTEKVFIPNTSFSYFVYLPSTYNANASWPLLVCLDPMARGSLAVEKFRSAAEPHGYIVVGSNDSRNGLEPKALLLIFESLWRDTHVRFNIDSKRVYVSGFSGGARVASAFAAMGGRRLRGVIGSGAGLSVGMKPSPDLPFIYFGAVGTDDFNYGEMRQLDRDLELAYIPHRIEVFAGGHTWMPESVAEQALAWFDLDAEKNRLGTVKNGSIISYERERQAECERLVHEQRYLDAYRSYKSLIGDLRGLRDVQPLINILTDLERSDELKRAIKAETEEIAEQQRIANKIRSLASCLLSPIDEMEGLPTLRSYIRTVRDIADSPEDSSKRRSVRRALNQVYAESIEAATLVFENQAKFSIAIAHLRLAVEIQPKNPSILYELARALALNNQKERSLAMLERAVQMGFRDVARIRIEQQTTFGQLSGEARFRALMSIVDSRNTN